MASFMEFIKFVGKAPYTNIPKLSLYILLKSDIGSGVVPIPASIVYPWLVVCLNIPIFKTSKTRGIRCFF